MPAPDHLGLEDLRNRVWLFEGLGLSIQSLPALGKPHQACQRSALRKSTEATGSHPPFFRPSPPLTPPFAAVFLAFFWLPPPPPPHPPYPHLHPSTAPPSLAPPLLPLLHPLCSVLSQCWSPASRGGRRRGKIYYGLSGIAKLVAVVFPGFSLKDPLCGTLLLLGAHASGFVSAGKSWCPC